MNLILNTDSYKYSHFCQYPPGTTRTHFYIESRGGRYPQTIFFGLQMFIKAYLMPGISLENIEEAKAMVLAHGLPFHEEGWRKIWERYQGKLPLKISAVPEGFAVPTGNVLLTIENTDSDCFWLPGFLETALLRGIWYPTTVATTSAYVKAQLKIFHEKSSDLSLSHLDFALHDFGARGASSYETSAIGGLAHLVSFRGTDTVGALVQARQYYGETLAGFSIPASEHSTMTAWGKPREQEAFSNMLDQFAKAGGVLAVVSDSYDIYHAVDYLWGEILRDRVQKSGARVVIRPDSGDPLTVPLKVIQHLMDRFGYSLNSKGYKVLPACVRVIQGDGVDPQSIAQILEKLEQEKISLDNIAFGMGAALLQKINRDTQKFAMKCSAVEVDGLWRDVFKDPITDQGKRSKAGRLGLCREGNQFETVSYEENLDGNLLRPVFENGELRIDESLEQIRARVLNEL